MIQTSPLPLPVIVIPAFNRAASLERLLKSIDRAEIPPEATIVISLEGGADPNVISVAEHFHSGHPSSRLIRREKRLGLRDHILACGDFALEYGAAIILEDDLLVDKYFYLYAQKAAHYYSTADSVAGIALYSPHFSEFSGLPFTPLNNGYATFPIRSPCSWGQLWLADHWREFRAWYYKASANNNLACTSLPVVARNWPESSWKKYFATFLIEVEKEIIYPYQSLTTNCADKGGTHINAGTNIFQVPLCHQSRKEPYLEFCPESSFGLVRYDSHFEPASNAVFEALGLSADDVEIDISGVKPIDLLRTKRYCLTRRPVKKYQRLFTLTFHPPELNLQIDFGPKKGPNLYFAESRDVVAGNKTLTSIELSYYLKIDTSSFSFTQRVLRSFLAQLPYKVRNRAKSLVAFLKL